MGSLYREIVHRSVNQSSNDTYKNMYHDSEVEFDWDQANIAHVEQHGIDPEEAEDAVFDEFALDFPTHRGPKGQVRFGVLGRALSKRVLVVILEEREEKFRVVTARLATPAERSIYDQKNT